MSTASHIPGPGSWKRTLLLVVASVLLTRPKQQAPAPGNETERDAARILESYRALDALATAVFQAGLAVGIGGVTIGLTIASRFGEIVVTGSALSLLAGLYAALAMIDFDERAPDAERLKRKTKEVSLAALGLVLVISFAVAFFLILLAATSQHRLGSLL